ISQVVPHFESDLAIVCEYRKALAAWDPKAVPTFGSMAGYISTRILLKAMEKTEGAPTRDSLVDALDGLGEFDIGLGQALKLSRDQHQACHHVWATMLSEGKVAPINWDDL